MTTNYLRFTEINEHEGETWRFYIPVEGNQDAIDRLSRVLEAHDLTETFKFNATPAPESVVDTIVAEALEDYEENGGYRPARVELEGRLVLPDQLEEAEYIDVVNLLYKGGIEDLMVPEEET